MQTHPPIDDTRQRILDAAARLFSRGGIASSSMREIAKECGIVAGSLYNHFESKDEIVSEIFDLGITCVADAVKKDMAKLEKNVDFRRMLTAATRAHLNAFFVYGDYTATHIRNFKQAPKKIQKKNIKARDAYETLWINLLEKGVASGALSADIDLNLARLLLFGSLNWTLEWLRPKVQKDLDSLAETAVRMFLHGCASSTDV